MKKIFLKEELFQEVITTEKGNVDSNMVLSLINGDRYKLVIAIKFIKEIAHNDTLTENNLVGQFISKEELISKNYELFDDEVVANEQLYKVAVGYIGTPLN